MRSRDIKAGKRYTAKVNGKRTTVEVVRSFFVNKYRQGGWTVGSMYMAQNWEVVDLETGNGHIFGSVKKFLNEVQS